MMNTLNRSTLLLLSGFVSVFLSGASLAQHQHDHGGAARPSAKPSGKSAEKGSVQSATIEGFKITFEVMDMSAHMAMPGMKAPHGSAEHSKSHVQMITLQDTASKEIISDAKVQYTLTSPSGAKETGRLEWSGDHYGVSFSPQEKGTYQMVLKIESGGMEREAKFQYMK